MSVMKTGKSRYRQIFWYFKKLKIPIKKIIDDQTAFISEDYVYTGKKTTSVLALEAATGKILKYFGEGSIPLEFLNDESKSDEIIYISRTRNMHSIDQ